jgi:hypothetical protein
LRLQEDAGMKLYEEPHFTFRFAEDRLIPRFHLEGVEVGRRGGDPDGAIVPAVGQALALAAQRSATNVLSAGSIRPMTRP